MLKYFKLLAVLLGLALSVFVVSGAQANSTTSWLGASRLNLQQEAQVSVPPISINGNIDCSQSDSEVCAVPTTYGSANFNSFAAMNGSQVFRPVVSYVDSQQHFMPIPNSNMAITYTTEPAYGLHIYFNYNLSGSIILKNPGTGPEYQIDRPPDGELADADGHRLPADYNSMSFSQNGQWMVVSDPNVALLRVNFQTLQVLPFAAGYNYTIGLTPGLQTAISNDGRYAIVASKNFNSFKIYDLSTCDSTPSTVVGSVNCQSRDLGIIMNSQVAGYKNSSTIRFIDDDNISFYATSQPGALTITAKFLLSDNGGISQLHYLALGDSYISGEGAFDYQVGTDTDDNRCHLSLISYPLLLGHDLNFDSYHSIACSGAVINDITNVSNSYAGQTKAHISRYDLGKANEIPSIINNFQPGYIDQLDFVTAYQPQIVTLSIGGNDTGFSDILQECVEPWQKNTCYATYEDRLELVRLIENQVFPDLVKTYQIIKAQGPPDMQLYAIGYPQIAKPDGDCADNVHLDADEVKFSQQIISYLDSVIQQAAAKAGVDYVDTQNALIGHRLCEAKPGSVAVNGVTAGNDRPGFIGGPLGDESYHPNDFGHELLENAILASTHKLTDSMPAADPNAALPAESGLDILNNLPSSGRPINILEPDRNISPDILMKNTLNQIEIDGIGHALSAAVTLLAELHSDPISLGTFTTSTDGDLSAQIMIPDSVPAGYHRLHFYSTDINGQPVDIYKTVYVADSPDDMNGDSIPDADEPCVGVLAVGQDVDKDGVDDSCDGTIGVPPIVPAVSSTTQVSNTDASAIESDQEAQADTKLGNNKEGQVLAAQTRRDAPQTSAGRLTTYGTTKTPDPKILALAGGACVWITICYAAYKFRA